MSNLHAILILVGKCRSAKMVSNVQDGKTKRGKKREKKKEKKLEVDLQLKGSIYHTRNAKVKHDL